MPAAFPSVPLLARSCPPELRANSDLIFSVPKIVSFLSQGTTLPAGTVILTGCAQTTQSPPARVLTASASPQHPGGRRLLQEAPAPPARRRRDARLGLARRRNPHQQDRAAKVEVEVRGNSSQRQSRSPRPAILGEEQLGNAGIERGGRGRDGSATAFSGYTRSRRETTVEGREGEEKARRRSREVVRWRE